MSSDAFSATDVELIGEMAEPHSLTAVVSEDCVEAEQPKKE